jgi:nitrite reductase/ring-hydroxylating ferredoxin subunit
LTESEIKLCNVSDVADGASLGLDPLKTGRDSHFVVRQGDMIRVYRNFCPHQGSPMAWRKDEYLNGDRSRIACHAHGAEFDIRTGQCVQGAALGLSLDPVDVEIRADGWIVAETRDIRS